MIAQACNFSVLISNWCSLGMQVCFQPDTPDTQTQTTNRWGSMLHKLFGRPTKLRLMPSRNYNIWDKEIGATDIYFPVSTHFLATPKTWVLRKEFSFIYINCFYFRKIQIKQRLKNKSKLEKRFDHSINFKKKIAILWRHGQRNCSEKHSFSRQRMNLVKLACSGFEASWSAVARSWQWRTKREFGVNT